MPELLKRDFVIADDAMIEDARTKHATFLEDKPDFITFDSDFADPYAADFESTINTAEATDDDETILDQITQLTDTVTEEEKRCSKKFQDSKFFIEKAFPDKLAIRNEFGFNDYNEAHRTTDSFIKFMAKFHKVATKYSVQLAAQNYDAAKVLEIKTRHDALNDANIEQELAIKNRPVKTADRITKLNAAWKIERAVCDAGKRVFIDNYAKYQRYLLPPGEETAEALSIQGRVTNSAGGAVEEEVEVRIEALDISVFTNAAGLYAFGGLPAGTYELLFRKVTLQDKQVPNVVVVDGEVTTLDVVMDPV